MSPTAGRPRKRSIEESLDLAMEVFWRRGYEGTSIQDLSEALGVGPSSLYNSFGSKCQLYLRCMERYLEQNNSLGAKLNHPSARQAVINLLDASAIQYTRDDQMPGCALLSAPRHDDPKLADIDDFCVSRRAATQQAIERTIMRGVAGGEFNQDTDTSAFAQFIMSMLRGMSAQAEDGASRQQLKRVAEQARIVIDTYTAHTHAA